jgi:hypothetical protein
MVNDSVASCRKSAAEAIKIMLGRLTKNIISTLYDITLTWLQGTKVMRKKKPNIIKINNFFFFF